LGWKSMGVLELTALPSIKRENWVSMVQQTDALLVGGGDCPYLSYWMQESGLARKNHAKAEATSSLRARKLLSRRCTPVQEPDSK
jgi:hypothetical protein